MQRKSRQTENTARAADLFLVSLVVFIISTESAYAYLDPAAGTLFLQAIVGIVASAAVTIRIYWDKIKAFLKRDS
jgi:hypothetical protein